MREEWRPLPVALGLAMRKQRRRVGIHTRRQAAAALGIHDSYLAAIEAGHRLIGEDIALRWLLLVREYVSYDKFLRLLFSMRALEHVRRRRGSPRAYIEMLSRTDLPLSVLLRTLEPLIVLPAFKLRKRLLATSECSAASPVLIEYWSRKEHRHELLELPHAA